MMLVTLMTKEHIDAEDLSMKDAIIRQWAVEWRQLALRTRFDAVAHLKALGLEICAQLQAEEPTPQEWAEALRLLRQFEEEAAAFRQTGMAEFWEAYGWKDEGAMPRNRAARLK